MVERCGLRRSRGASVVMHRDGVEELGPDLGVEPRGALLDQTEAEVDVAQEAPLLGRPVERSGTELDRPANVVQERGGQQDVAPQARVELCRLAADRGDADRVLEEAPRVAVVPVGCRRD